MRFITFINSIEHTPDTNLKAFISWVNNRRNFPQSSNPAVHLVFLEGKLNEAQILGYKIAMMLYFGEPKNQLPRTDTDKKAFLEIINRLH